ncbi:MAG: AAA domain-containing protein [Bacteroidota bacterium]|nr:AAA domain-containing protein [Bacteroidota bacterium]
MSKETIEALFKLQELLLIEKEEDFRQYQEKFLRSSLTQRRENGLTWYPIKITTTDIGLGEYLIVEVERTSGVDESHQMQAGKNAELFTSNEAYSKESISGIIKSVSKNRLKLALTTDDLPDWATEGKLGINLLFDENSYREMQIALKKVVLAENNRLAELREILYGTKKASFNKEEDIKIESLNDSQNQAVKKIVAARDIAIVHGPPGTGKTTTLVQAIIQTLKTEKQILVCSPSNLAVDLMTEKLAEKGINVLRLGNPIRVSENLLKNTLDAKVAADPSFKDIKEYRKQAEEYKSMASKYKRSFGKAERNQRNMLRQEAKEILKEARALEEYIISGQFDKAQVIACTPVVSAGRYLRDKIFDTVFIDEAAQALEPACWIPISRSNRVIFAGDHFQLPPTVKSKKAETGGLSTTLFEKTIAIQDVAVMLKVQYRMHENIMGFSNQKFYHGELIADDLVKNGLLEAGSDHPSLNTALEFIDTAGCGYSEVLNSETLSFSNPEEARLLLKHLARLLEQYYEKNKKTISIGIISPYKEQVQFINDELLEHEYLNQHLSNIVVKTVDGFQGREKDIIYISLVRSNDTGEIGFLNDIRRMNVALTRAKKKLVVIGDSATLAYNSFYNDFLTYIETIESYKSAWEYMD